MRGRISAVRCAILVVASLAIAPLQAQDAGAIDCDRVGRYTGFAAVGRFFKCTFMIRCPTRAEIARECGPIAPPAPPPPPPPPPPPVRLVCNTGPYIVFFSRKDNLIGDDYKDVLNSAVSQYPNCGTARVSLVGHTDSAGSVADNLTLSVQRAKAVEAYLAAKGIPFARFMVEGRGESQPRIPTADGVREIQNERVEIMFDPGSAM